MAQSPTWSAPLLTAMALLAGCTASTIDSPAVAVAVMDHEGAPLGSVAVAPSCDPAVADAVRRGFALLHNMTYTAAEAEFASVLEEDPECGIAHWGRAMSFVHPLWPDVPTAEQLKLGAEILAEAREADHLSALERSYVEALAAYYEEAGSRTEGERITGFWEGWSRTAAAFPEDREAQLFLALAEIARATSSANRVADQIAAGQRAEQVLQEIPDHTGALHYIIHAHDLAELAERALPAARTYGEVAPDNSHALHMTSHIFTRVGQWDESVRYNSRAADAGLQNPVNGALAFDYLHAVDYLVYAALQRGDDVFAHRIRSDVEALEGPIQNHPASAYALAAVPVRIALERGDWASARTLPVRQPEDFPWDGYPQFEAMVHFARGLGAAREGAVAEAQAALAALQTLREAAGGLPIQYDWATQVEIQEMALAAWLAYMGGEIETGIQGMADAAELEATTVKNPVTPGEVLPAGELLGDMLALENRHAEALEAYEAALSRTPNRLNSLIGAARAARAMGDEQRADTHYRAILSMAVPEARLEAIAEARRVAGGA
ncbi:MAG: hypothetical protein HKO77_02940 [Gemmatimonadetes bacterium]|nr:hypothetical protein [Gemmatimonadota bacterium]